MKTITNRLTGIATGKTEPSFEDFFSLAKICLNQPPHGGFDVETMGKRLRVMERLDTASGSVELEDADYETLKSCVLAGRWGILHQDIAAFVEHIKQAPSSEK